MSEASIRGQFYCGLWLLLLLLLMLSVCRHPPPAAVVPASAAVMLKDNKRQQFEVDQELYKSKAEGSRQKGMLPVAGVAKQTEANVEEEGALPRVRGLGKQ